VRAFAVVASIAIALVLSGLATPADACTSFLVTKGASADGSTLLTYSADSHVLYGELPLRPAAFHAPGDQREIIEWDTGKRLGHIDEVPRTYSVVGNINEHQLVIAESTWGGREELQSPEGTLDYGSLMWIALERAKTAREAIRVMTDLVAKHGYASTGETFSIADPNEAWILEMIGKGPKQRGAVWVARRVPDGFISGHANAARIRRFSLTSPTDTLFSPDVISFARAQGWFAGKDAEFSFADVYNPVDFGARRFCDARVWCMFRRAAPGKPLSTAWIEGADPKAEPLPLWIAPDRKVTVADVMGFMRDHFEGTPLDMTQDVGAGASKLPYRWRPLTWKLDGKEYFNERAVSTQQTGFSFVAQARGWLPGPIGGLLWFGVDDTAATVYFPVYAGSSEVSKPYAVGAGSFDEVSWDSAFWVFNQVSNFSYLRYADMSREVRAAQRGLEAKFLAATAEVDAAALAQYQQSPRLAKDYLTRYSVAAGDEVVTRWRALSKHLLLTFLDGNVKDEHGKVLHPDHDEAWRRAVVQQTGDRLRVRPTAWDEAQDAKKQAQAKATRAALLTVLEARHVPVDASADARIRKTDEQKKLEGWLVKAATAVSIADVLGGDVEQPH
jgi:dipeptidase